MGNKITTVTIAIPYKRAGNVISQQEVAFDMYDDFTHFTLVPCLDFEERLVANLPEGLHFVLEYGKPVSLRGPKDGNLHVIQDAVARMREEGTFV